MANKPSRPSTRTAAPAWSDAEVRKRGVPWMWIAIVAVVALAAGVAIFSAGDDETLTEGTVPATTGQSTGDTAGSAGSAVAEVWPVTITGTPLVELPDSGDDPAVGTPAPGLSGFTFDGTPIAIDPSTGPVLLVFLAHWCPHCNREIPEFLDWKASGAVPDGMQVIAVTTAVDPTRDYYPPSQWIVDKGWEWPVMADSKASDAALAMGVSGFPFSVIIGQDGTVLGRISGELGASGIQEWVDATLA